MGMDVYGIEPSSDMGLYFRRTVWGWRPLAELIGAMAPEIAAKCKHWQTNDGDGLAADDARSLADALEQKLADGEVQAWIAQRDELVAQMPNETCRWCSGSGVRSDNVGQKADQPTRICKETTDVNGANIPHPRAGMIGWCNACDGRGWNVPRASYYHVDADDVYAFAAFARASGGFKIL